MGNVLTQPEFRGRGYAQATTAAVTAQLLEFCDHVVLNVRSDNPQGILDKVAANGGTVVMPLTEVAPDTTIALFADPEGHIVGIM